MSDLRLATGGYLERLVVPANYPVAVRSVQGSYVPGELQCLRFAMPAGSFGNMADVTRVLANAAVSDPHAAAELLPLVYGELRKLAAARLAEERPGQTLQPTALVHEAYLRLVGDQHFDNRGHFFAAAAEAMRRILVDRAREKAAVKRGGGWSRIDLNSIDVAQRADPDDLLELDETLDKLARNDPVASEIVKLRFFAGLSIDLAADMLGLSRTVAYERWAFARAWLYSELKGQAPETTD